MRRSVALLVLAAACSGAGGGGSAGGSTAGGSTAGGSTAGGSTAGGSTAGGSTAGGSTAGGSTAGGGTAGGGTAGASAAGGAPDAGFAYAESFSLPDGGPWPAPWTVAGGVATADVQAGRARLVPTLSGYSLARMKMPATLVNVEVVFDFQLPGTPQNQGVGFYVRQNGGHLTQTMPAGAGYAIFIEAFRSPPGIGAWREVNGQEQEIQPHANVALAAGTTYRARLRCTQQNATTTRLQGRFWAVTVAEPAAWQVDVTDTTASLQNVAGGFAIDSWSSLTTGGGTAAPLLVDDVIITGL